MRKQQSSLYPRTKNGDNLIEIRDKDIVTAFAIEDIRLIDHFSWLNRLMQEEVSEAELNLYDDKEEIKWYEKYYNPNDLKFLERTFLMK